MSFINNHYSPSDLMNLIMSSTSSFEIINAAVPNPWICWIAASVADIIADNQKGSKTFLANCVSTFFQ